MPIESNAAREAIATKARRGELGPSLPILVFVVTVVATCVYQLSSSNLQFDAVNLHSLTAPSDEVAGFISLGTFALIRTAFAVVGLFTIKTVTCGPPLTLTSIYDRDSKITGPILLTFWGLPRLGTFTVQTFTLQTAFHVVTAVLTSLAACGIPVTLPRFFLAAIWVAYQVTAACALLVTVIVTFVLVPGLMRKGGSPAVMFLWPAQVTDW